MKKLLLIAFILPLISFVASAQTLNETFESYTLGNLAEQGYWVDNPKYVAGDPITVASPGLNGNKAIYISPGASNGSGPVIPFGDGEKLTKNATTGIVYVSFLVKFNASPSSTTDNYFFYLADMSASPISTDGRGRLYARSESADEGAKFAFGAIASSNSTADLTYTGYNYEIGKTYLVIEKYEKTSGADKVSLWIFDQTITGGAIITPPVPNFSSSDTETGTSKKEISGVGFRRMNASYDIIVDDIKSNIVWGAVNDTEVPLPVKLTSFSGAVQNSTVKLNWVTASEQNNSHFEVLRSEDGKTFNILTSVSGNGTTQSVNNYSYIDTNPLSGANYYQLRQVDFDGKSELSKVIAVRTAMEKSSLSVHATSASAFAEISSYSLTNQKAVIRISSVSGSHIATQTVNLIKGYNTLQIPMQIQPGVYVATLTAGSSSLSTKFVAQ